ncbi:gliding motility-associated C-terminal domain-containing protein [Lunatimonas salinarum]|uniref:T9SS type B sorting domain-containing protein n=1 Tax=Lunatimonas salinarum TaxID=1774590 RepID=UPI001AE0BEE0|nr:gliding motility-associated C-terminal domain-containing protein [Lunatimonas salinarum]
MGQSLRKRLSLPTWNICLMVLFLFQAAGMNSIASAQSNPSLTITKEDASCPGNGSILATIAVDGTTTLTNVVFSLFLPPNFQEPLVSNGSGIFDGLSQGNYLVRATGESSSTEFLIESEVEIQRNVQGLNFFISAQDICSGNDGVLTAIVETGSPTSFELRGAKNHPPQTNPSFSNLSEGLYTLIIVDECGEVYSQDYQLTKPSFGIDPSYQEFNSLLPSCDLVTVGHRLVSTTAAIQFPVEVTWTIAVPNGAIETITREFQEGDLTRGTFFSDIPFFQGTSYTYQIQATDNCGFTTPPQQFTINKTISISDDLRWGAGLCGRRRLSIKPQFAHPPFTIEFDAFPEGFDPGEANPNFPGPFTENNIFFGSPEDPIPDGFYALTLSDACGNTASISVDHRTIVGAPSATVLKSCTPGFASLELLNFDYFLENVTLVDGPPEFGQSFPVDLSQHISQVDSRRFFLGEIPSGDYTFEVKTSCGDEVYRRTYPIAGTTVTSEEITVEENCGTFSVFLNYLSDIPNSQNLRFGLQRKDPQTGVWGHPQTGVPYEEGQELTAANAVMLFNGQSNINLAYSGDLRIVKAVRVFKDGADILPGESAFTQCISTVKEFYFAGRAELVSINFFSCGNGFYDVYFSEVGYEPVTYSIVSINGIPVDIQNGTDPLFRNLEAGRYRFRMIDRCGNTTTSSLTLFGSNLPAITPTNLCEGENGSLLVPFFEQVDYEWFRTDAPDVILSTEHILRFSPFSIDTHAGVYQVRLSLPDPESCINETLEFTIDPEQVNGKAGIGQVATICFGEIVDLFDYLAPPFGMYGTWEDLNNSGQLTGNLWNTEGLSPGEYEFGYKIFGLCAGEDETVVKLTLLPPIESPEGLQIQEFCATSNPTLESLQVSGENIRWHATPAGDQPLSPDNPLQDRVTYYAEQVIGGCPSAERLPVSVRIYPELTNAVIQENQVVFQLQPIDPLIGQPVEGGKLPYTYQWERSLDGENWTEITEATEAFFAPEPILENTYFRRIVRDQLCGELISNVILIETKVAPIQATADRYGPIKGFEENILGVWTNDLFMERPIQPGEVTFAVTSVTDDSGTETNLNVTFDQVGNLVLAPGAGAGNYVVEYQICQTGIPGNCSDATVELWVGRVEITLEKRVDRQRAVEGEILTFFISATNNSPFALENVILEDILPDGLMFLSASITPTGSYQWNWESLGMQENIEITLDVMATQDGDYVNEVRISAGDFEQAASSPEVIVRVRESELSLTKTVTPEEVEDGDTFFYELEIQNNGIDEGTDLSIFDRLPVGVRFVSWEFESTSSEITPSLTNSGRLLTWNVAKFPVNASLIIRVEVVALTDGTFTNEAWVVSEALDPDTANNASQVSKQIKPLFIPNVIKPDNDGKNETFIVRAEHKFEKTELVIFNRWGDPVFQSDDYQNDWNASGLNSGTYYYQLNGYLPGGEKIQYNGWVQVIK